MLTLASRFYATQLGLICVMIPTRKGNQSKWFDRLSVWFVLLLRIAWIRFSPNGLTSSILSIDNSLFVAFQPPLTIIYAPNVINLKIFWNVSATSPQQIIRKCQTMCRIVNNCVIESHLSWRNFIDPAIWGWNGWHSWFHFAHVITNTIYHLNIRLQIISQAIIAPTPMQHFSLNDLNRKQMSFADTSSPIRLLNGRTFVAQMLCKPDSAKEFIVIAFALELQL